jgi:hypothetical protein
VRSLGKVARRACTPLVVEEEEEHILVVEGSPVEGRVVLARRIRLQLVRRLERRNRLERGKEMVGWDPLSKNNSGNVLASSRIKRTNTTKTRKNVKKLKKKTKDRKLQSDTTQLVKFTQLPLLFCQTCVGYSWRH